MYFSNLLIFSAHLDDRKKKGKVEKKALSISRCIKRTLRTSYGVEVEKSDQRLER